MFATFGITQVTRQYQEIERQAMSQKNIEIKAFSSEAKTARIRSILGEEGATCVGTDHQIDTYFNVDEGRLKLRQGNIENALVYYERTNKAGPKLSDVKLAHFRHDQTEPLREILVKTLGTKVVVDKQREIWTLPQYMDGYDFAEGSFYIKFHLDGVDRLGEFVEIEVIDRDDQISAGEMLYRCEHWMDQFGITEDDLVKESYSDLLGDSFRLLEFNGWTIECESPLEISHHDGSRATGQAAQCVIDCLQGDD